MHFDTFWFGETAWKPSLWSREPTYLSLPNFLHAPLLFWFHSLDEASVFITEYYKHCGKPVPPDATPCETLKVNLAQSYWVLTWHYFYFRDFEIESTCSGILEINVFLCITACIFLYERALDQESGGLASTLSCVTRQQCSEASSCTCAVCHFQIWPSWPLRCFPALRVLVKSCF